MTIRYLPYLALCLTATLSTQLTHAQDSASVEREIGVVLDDFHDAAAHGDNARYLGHLTENGVFMGTDEWERWPKRPDFIAYVNSRFKDGQGWTYRSVERNVNVSADENVAWFDEVIFSASNGRFRGTGVVVKLAGEWKIAHYAMSFLIFNEDWEAVVELSRQTSAQKNANE